MTVDMNGLRWQLLNNYNSLTKKLNKGIKKYEVFYDELKIQPASIEKEMESIKQALVFLAYSFDTREGGFEILENPHFELYNETEEEK